MPIRDRMLRPALIALLALVAVSAASPQSDEPLELHFFWTPGCSECREVREEVVLPLVEAYPRIAYHEHNLAEPDAMERLVQFFIRYGVPEDFWSGPTVAFVGVLYYIGTDEVAEKLPLAVEKLLVEGWEVPEDWKPDDARSRLVEFFDRFGASAIAAAGLADSINPCAIAALVFMLSLLSFAGRSSRAILATGLLFAAGVYAAYFGVGVGIFRGLEALRSFDLAAQILYPLAALGTLALTVLSLRDYLRARSGAPEEMVLKLPRPLLRASHAVTRTFVKGRWYLALAFAAGMTVALLELFCTGQLYLPTLIYISSMYNLRSRALSLLGLYVFMFTLPIIVLTVAVWAGVSSTTIRDWAREHTATSKLIMTVVFAILTLALLAIAIEGAWAAFLPRSCCG
ncbi:MAG: hypothetical protein GX131_20555 [candidate division WS1 bacterium]|jgi:hypothetical protein|nr:hypothetical protein [candidate division WS1 bacterium]